MGQRRESNLYEQLDCTDEEETTQTDEGTFGIQSDVTMCGYSLKMSQILCSLKAAPIILEEHSGLSYVDVRSWFLPPTPCPEE